jgi:anion-transporting  ArsA/GET3 family ATPase
MMLDVQNTFDRVVERYAPDEVTRQRILGNRLYKNISTRLSGSQEYASMQRLYEIAQEGVYDRIVLDTPPTTHALDFLMAPHRLTEFFDSRVMQLFISFGGRVGWGLLRRSTDVFFKAVDRLTGAGLVGEIADFFRIAETILEPYRSQAGETERLLRSADTTFFVVTGPNAHQIDDARKFRETLGAMGISVSAVIVNRVLGETLPPDASLPQPQHNDALADEAAEWGARLELLARAQTAATRSLDSEQADVALVPQFDEDVHSLEGLMKIEAALRSE